MGFMADIHLPDVVPKWEKLNACIIAMHCRSASFATPAHVRREWAEEHGLSAFQSSGYDAALEAVTKRLGVTTGKQHVQYHTTRQSMHVYSESPINTGHGLLSMCCVTTNLYIGSCCICLPSCMLCLLQSCDPILTGRGLITAAASRHLGAQQSQRQAQAGTGKAGVALVVRFRGTQAQGHACGHCSFGCAYGDKQDATATFLADAVQAGARIITGMDLIAASQHASI